MVLQIRKHLKLLAISIILAILFLSFESYIPGSKFINLKIYDLLSRIEYKLRKLPPETKKIVIVSIDNESISKMPYRWPYPRSLFAKVIQNLALAHAKVIAFDFVFLGKSEEAEDKALEETLRSNNNIILASSIDEGGSLNIHSLPRLSGNVPSGIVTKLQDFDGAIRRNLTYLISDEIPPKGFLSWEMAILKMTEGLGLTPVKGDECYISIKDDRHEKWMIPVDCYNKSFMINFRAQTRDFAHISFYNAYKGDFDPDMVKDRLVLIGFVSSLLGDIHNTPIGWMPGIILNANSLLTLCTRDFITNVPVEIDRSLTILGVILSVLTLLLFGGRIAAIFISVEIVTFFIASYVLLATGYTIDYFAFPFSVALLPFLGKKIYSWIWQRKKFYWT